MKKSSHTFCSLLKFEIRKAFVIPILIAIFLLFIIKLVIVNYTHYSYQQNFDEKYYTEYIDKLQAMSQAEADTFITSESERLNIILSSKELYESDYANGKITMSQLNSFNVEYIKATNQQLAFAFVESKHAYYDSLYEQGQTPEYFCEFEILHFLEKLQGTDILLSVFIIYLITSMLAVEDTSGMREMISSTKNGRKKAPFVLAIFLIVTFVFILTTALELMLRLNDGVQLELLGKQLCNLSQYSDYFDKTIFSFAAMTLVVKYFWCIVLSLVTTLLYNISKNRTVTTFVALAIVVVSLTS